MPTLLHNEGEQYMLNCSFDESRAPPNCLYVGLCYDTPVEGDTMATLASELASVNGYSRQAVSTNTTYISTSLDSGDYQSRLSTVTFLASGGPWSRANHAFVTTSATGSGGKLIASFSLSADRTLTDTDRINTTLRFKLQ